VRRIDEPGILQLHQLFHYGEHIIVALIDKYFRVFLIWHPYAHIAIGVMSWQFMCRAAGERTRRCPVGHDRMSAAVHFLLLKLLNRLVNKRTAHAGFGCTMHLIGPTSFRLIRSALRYLSCSKSGLAPHTGHVSNLCYPTGIVIEPKNA
jgi:hypothetical protein